MTIRYIIQDWAGNTCFDSKEFDTPDDAEDFLCETLDNTYVTDREDYYIVKKDSSL